MGLLSANNSITSDALLQRKPNLLFNEIDGEVVLLSLENNEYLGMDRVGSHIWEMLKQPISVKNLVFSLIGDYQVNEQQCMEDTMAFLKKLEDKNLITVL